MSVNRSGPLVMVTATGRRASARAGRREGRPSAATIDAAFHAFVSDRRFPCLGGASVARRRAYRLHVYGALGTAKSAGLLARDLGAFVDDVPMDGRAARAFIAVFPQRPPANETTP